ncbi:MAG: hypothetical protein DRP78_03815 [Candidatus Omnitrophota bacterium]|nr:MAG: hypothetical protein DRP78_03815 [Candidatus Omnitrophota bacterium]
MAVVTSYLDMELSEQEYKLFSALIYKFSGINLGSNKKELLKARLMKRVKYYKFDSYRQYYDYLLSGTAKDEFVELLNVVSTNVTSFFREKNHFDYLNKYVFPAIVQNKKKIGSNKIRIWSAASSTGEEPYTILICLLEYFKNILAWDVKLLATDISTKVLLSAQQGVYGYEKVKGIPLQLQSKYFDQGYNGRQKILKAKNILRDLVVFRRLNLMRRSFPFKRKFDIIFCRNVMIYFDKKTQNELVKKFYHYLENDGYLFIGHSESLLGAGVDFKSVTNAVFKKQGC